jgi:hypothetical protein
LKVWVPVPALVLEPVPVRVPEPVPVPARALATAKPLVKGQSGRVRHCHNLPLQGRRRREIPLKRKSVERWSV